MPIKDPDSTEDFGVDWNRRVEPSGQPGADGSGYLAAGEIIATSTWAVPNGLTKTTDSHTDTTTTVWLSGGTLWSDYDVVNHVTTSQGRSADRTVRVKIRQQ